MRPDFMFISESVTKGHPDKLCDQISDAIVDHYLEQDPYAHVVAESAVSAGVLFVAERHASTAKVDVAEVARQVIKEVGYTGKDFNAEDCTIMTSIHELPPELRQVMDLETLDEATLNKLVTRHQVTAFGFACRQTPALMPLPIVLAHRLVRTLDRCRQAGEMAYLMPDGKTQIGITYRDRKPERIHSITLIASQRTAQEATPAALADDIAQKVIAPCFADEELRPDEQTRIFINPEGPFIGGGPAMHSGLTGRKTAIDTYGEYARHSGAALSGKAPWRIDRISAYAARYAAKNIVAAGLADECEVQLSYSIGQAQPVSLQVQTFGTGTEEEREIVRRLEAHMDFRFASIIRRFDLLQLPLKHAGRFYRDLACYGHMGRTDLDLPWEHIDIAEGLRG